MRLTCPNCKAQYEVDERVIPDGGRDVQCSSCGSTWFQYPAEVALRMRAADLDDDDDDDDDPDLAKPAPRPPQPEGGGERRIDRTVLDVLREEAQRELTERRRTAPAMETQTEMGLVNRPRPRAKSGDADAPSPRPPPPKVSEAEPQSDVPRRNLLPDIEELTSTLEPGRHARKRDDPPVTDEAPAEARRGRDFRRGLSAVLLVGGILVALYLLAPTLAQMVPALSGSLAGYVAMIDALRVAVAGLVGG